MLAPPVGRGHLLPAHVAPDERVELLVMVSPTTVLWVGGCSARVVVPCVLPVLAHSLTYLRACLVVRAVVGVEQRALLGLVADR